LTLDYVLLQTNAVARFIAVLNTTEELAFTSTGDYLGDGKQYHCKLCHVPGEQQIRETNHGRQFHPVFSVYPLKHRPENGTPHGCRDYGLCSVANLHLFDRALSDHCIRQGSSILHCQISYPN
jgi:hypothetical protein